MSSLKNYKVMLSQNIQKKDELPRIFNELPLNIDNFVKEFKEKVKSLAFYFKLIVNITLKPNRGFEFFFELPSVGFFISLLQYSFFFERISINRVDVIKIDSVSLKELVFLSIFKFGLCDHAHLSMVMSTVRSMGLVLKP